MLALWRKATVLAIWLVIAHSAFAENKPQGTALSEDDLKTLFASGSMLDQYNVQNRERSSLVLTANGTAYTHWLHALGYGGQDSGTWRIASGSLCLNLKARTMGAERCYRHYKVGENSYEAWFDDGIARPHLVSTYRLRQ